MNKQAEELLYQALETELGGEQVYKTAIECAQTDELREEWRKYLEETQNHQRIVLQIFDQLGLDANRQTPGREVVRHLGESFIKAMTMVQQAVPGELAELVAAECVVLAETKDHQNWELIGELAREYGVRDRRRVRLEPEPPVVAEQLALAV